MRDYLAAIRERVVVFDGSMGATLEQYDLTPADYGGLQGKCHEALVLHRPDVIAALHESMARAGAEVVQTDSFQGARCRSRPASRCSPTAARCCSAPTSTRC